MLELIQFSRCRPDVRTARLVELALQVQRVSGTRAAAAMLVTSGTNFRVIVRVLSEPYQRRGWVKRAFADKQADG
jgi:hypothetical protein